MVPESIAVNKPYTINLNTIFQENEGDYLTYKVKVNGGAEETADAHYHLNQPLQEPICWNSERMMDQSIPQRPIQ